MFRAPWERPFLRAERVEKLRFALLVAGLPDDIAQEFAAIAHAGDRKRRRQHEIRIVLLLRARVMLQVITPIGAGLGEDRIGAEPLAQHQIDLLVCRQASMRAVMHQDRKPELARADDADRQQEGQRVGPPRDQGDRTQDQRPGMRDQGNPLPRHALAHGDQLILVQEVAGTHAKRGHDASPSNKSESDVSRSSTRRSRMLLSAVLVVAWSPSTRSISAPISSADLPIAWPSTVTPMASAQNRRELASGSRRLFQPCRSIWPA